MIDRIDRKVRVHLSLFYEGDKFEMNYDSWDGHISVTVNGEPRFYGTWMDPNRWVGSMRIRANDGLSKVPADVERVFKNMVYDSLRAVRDTSRESTRFNGITLTVTDRKRQGKGKGKCFKLQIRRTSKK